MAGRVRNYDIVIFCKGLPPLLPRGTLTPRTARGPLWRGGPEVDSSIAGHAARDRERKLIDDMLLADIREANLTYLILAQRMLRTDRAQGMFRLGIGEEVAGIVEALSTAQMIKVASTNMLMCKLRFDDSIVWNLIARNDDVLDIKKTHAAILLARALPEAA